MTKNEISVGGVYVAKVSGKLVKVRVDEIRAIFNSRASRNSKQVYDVTNLATGRKTTFHSAAKFRYAPLTTVATKQKARIKAPRQPENATQATQVAPSPVSSPKTTPTLSSEVLGVAPTAPVAPVSPSSPPVSGKWDRLQQAVARKANATDTAPHLIVEALAGTGKTFTEIVGVAWAFAGSLWEEIQAGIALMQNKPVEGFKIVPSAEQQLVWDQFALSRGKINTIIYCAFNKSIVTEFGEKWDWLVRLLRDRLGINLQLATINSLGNQSLYRAYGRLNITRDHTANLLASHYKMDLFELRKKEFELIKGVTELVDLCKLNLTGWTKEEGFQSGSITHEMLDELAAFYDIQLNGNREKVFDLIPVIMQNSLAVEQLRETDFNGQNWLPVVKNLNVAKADFLMIDEAQDLPRCKQEFALKTGRRIVAVGDVNQAIYGFAGADTDSIPRMCKLLNVTQPLQLTETRRCGKAIVQAAREIVPDFTAHESNPEGLVRSTSMAKYAEEVVDGDMCLCRVNAPLISQALKLIRDGRKAVVRGRKFGQELINFVKKLKASDVGDLIEKMDQWAALESQKEGRKRNPSEARLMAIEDRKACIHAFCEGTNTIEEVQAKMGQVFAGKECPCCRAKYNEESEECFKCKVPLVQPKGVLYSSVHRAKGLESKRVFILTPPGASMPHPMAKTNWAKGQERNLIYIARTRAIEELVYVS